MYNTHRHPRGTRPLTSNGHTEISGSCTCDARESCLKAVRFTYLPTADGSAAGRGDGNLPRHQLRSLRFGLHGGTRDAALRYMRAAVEALSAFRADLRRDTGGMPLGVRGDHRQSGTASGRCRRHLRFPRGVPGGRWGSAPGQDPTRTTSTTWSRTTTSVAAAHKGTVSSLASPLA
jgi:hypothetical protein